MVGAPVQAAEKAVRPPVNVGGPESAGTHWMDRRDVSKGAALTAGVVATDGFPARKQDACAAFRAQFF